MMIASLVAMPFCACSSSDDAGPSGNAGSGGSTSDAADTGTGGSDEGGDVKSDAPEGGSNTLGARCELDTDCTGGLQCIMTVAKGLCSVGCSQDPSVCAQFGAGAFCEDIGPGDGVEMYCVENCTFGPKGSSTIDTAKCHGRTEMACSAHLDATTTACSQQSSCGAMQACNNGKCADITPVCKPRCNSDADCGSGRYCLPKTGLCSPSPPTGDPIGSTCGAGFDACQGKCLAGGGTAFCSAVCTKGVKEACGWDGTGKAPAGCTGMSVPVNKMGAGAGDEGLCVQLCDCGSDCLAPGFVCDRLSASYAAFFGRPGGCVPAAYALDAVVCDGGVNDGGTDASTD